MTSIFPLAKEKERMKNEIVVSHDAMLRLFSSLAQRVLSLSFVFHVVSIV